MEEKLRRLGRDEAGGILRPVLMFLLALAILGIVVWTCDVLWSILEPLRNIEWLFCML